MTRPDTLKIALAQLNPVVGDVTGNLERARRARIAAARLGADAVMFSELFLSAYPPEDLVLRPAFQAACRQAVELLAAETADGGPAVLIGTPWLEEGRLYNAFLLLDGGRIVAVRHKVDLPNYGVFDEKRLFVAGAEPGPVTLRGVRVGLPICEDIWGPDVVETLAETGAEVLLVPNGSPYSQAKDDLRLNIAVARVAESGLPLVYLNQLGGQDELVFDGGSFGLQADCALAFQMPQFEEQVALVELRREEEGWRIASGPLAACPEDDEAHWRACVLGLSDYVGKNGFPTVVLGLSGGIDSALVAALAVDALGADRVHAVMLPYRYTSSESLAAAAACAATLGLRYDVLPIAEPVEALNRALAPLFADRAEDVTEENLQSRVRGTMLMAVSNKFGALLLTTGNKSEMSVGYATLYGDMNGGFNPIKDLYKTDVYRLAAWRNVHRPAGMLGPEGVVIPPEIIARAPSAELRENQTDQDALPPYEVLDDILRCLVEGEMRVQDVVARGHDPATVARVEHLLAGAEYKRRQAAPGIKISDRNFGRDRRYPITNRFRDRPIA
ncbi:NAD+ synthase [Prosthecomicrobium pneumaticum]|uniref:Glutamine-dependent NAD(+) synthetase n=1 Tax=Prosthecomicrobium pneumaticum TaxID=81895 RepID=A0A7W9FKM2_9HYPH|nr:NAD+ synthase [Prosthecomicrobium pneumaticum]MBB5751078.1 NAD+ synthase [Prosthecomicrobium pneumaticum]